MYLRDLAVFASKFGPSNNFTKAFDVSTHIVVEPVLAWIPRNKVVLDDLAKLNVSPGNPETPNCKYKTWQGVGTYYAASDFDFEHYSRLDEAAQQEIILELLSNAFTYVADQSGGNPSLCLDARERVREYGLPLPRLNSPEFWRAMPAHQRRSKSFRENIEFSADIIDRKYHALAITLRNAAHE